MIIRIFEEGRIVSYTYRPLNARLAHLTMRVAVEPQFSGQETRSEEHEAELHFYSPYEARATLIIQGQSVDLPARFEFPAS